MSPRALLVLVASFIVASARPVGYVVRGWVGGVVVGYLALPSEVLGSVQWQVFASAAVLMAGWILASLVHDFRKSRDT